MSKLESWLGQPGKIAIAGHVRPDGDCVGSCLALYNYITAWHPEREVSLYLEPIPNIFRFLANSGKIKSDCSEDQEYGLFFALDCGDVGRLGAAAKYFRGAGKTVCIDHHVSNESFADENYVFPETSSTSELVYGLMDKEKITKEIAECIYVGIVHDTGVFQYQSTSAKTMGIAGDLMERGIDFTRIVDDTFYKKTFAQNKILGQALLNSELLFGGRVIAAALTKEEMERHGALPKHLEGIVNQLRVTKGVEVAVFLYENGDGSWKVSLRSNGPADVAAIAVKFGGGGHKKAAGATVSGSLADVLRKISAEIEKELPEW